MTAVAIVSQRYLPTIRALVCILLFLIHCTFPPNATGLTNDIGRVLARVEVTGFLEDLGLPIHADLTDAMGRRYALVMATVDSLQAAGVSYTVIDAVTPGIPYVLAFTKKTDVRRQARSVTRVLYDDGRQIVVRSAPGLHHVLSGMGFRLRLVSETPMVLKKAPSISDLKERAFETSALVSEMIGAVDKSVLTSRISELSGEDPVVVDGAAYTLTTRCTTSGEPIQKATRYAYEYFTGLGLSTGFQSWSWPVYGWSGRNVICEIPGATLPEEIILIVAHIDNMPESGRAPGADDNASGTAAVMAAAGIMKNYRFERTVRFVLFTGEEQYLCGSDYYADSVSDQNIVGVVNLDMVSYNKDSGTPKHTIYTRSEGSTGYEADLEIANMFKSVIQDYGLAESISSIIISDSTMAYSDHYSFWANGFPAVFIFEDENYETPYYHTAGDLPATLNMDYFTAIVKASLGTAAHLAAPAGRKAGYVPLPLLLDSRLGSEWLVYVSFS